MVNLKFDFPLIVKMRTLPSYSDPQKYWDKRWEFDEEKTSLKDYEKRIQELMVKLRCNNILDIGCGSATLRNLRGYLGLDFSHIILNKSQLTEYIYADFSKHIPLPDSCFDAALCANVLLHVPPSKIDKAIDEICRVARNVIILIETYKFKSNQPHCFAHNLPNLFKRFDGEVFILTEEKT